MPKKKLTVSKASKKAAAIISAHMETLTPEQAKAMMEDIRSLADRSR